MLEKHTHAAIAEKSENARLLLSTTARSVDIALGVLSFRCDLNIATKKVALLLCRGSKLYVATKRTDRPEMGHVGDEMLHDLFIAQAQKSNQCRLAVALMIVCMLRI